MNKRMVKALLTGRKPKSSLKGVRGETRVVKWNMEQTGYLLRRLSEPQVVDVRWENRTPAACSELSETYDELRDILLRGLGVPAHLLRNT